MELLPNYFYNLSFFLLPLHILYCMLLVVFWLWLMNLLCTGAFVMQLYINYHVQEYYEVYTSVTCCHFIVGALIEILNVFTYTFLAPPTSSFGIHVCETTLIQSYKDYDNEGSNIRS